MATAHGDCVVGGFLSTDLESLGALTRCQGLEAFDARDFLFIDTETTGLAAGAGTIAFLIGLAWFEDAALVVRQLFIPGLGREGPALREVADRIEAAPAIASYNGRAFDWRLLSARFIMNRIPPPPVKMHVDLLHAARRIWARRLGGARLVQLESMVIGHHRVGDIAGGQIPEVYFDFLATGDVGRLPDVFTHNVLDLVSLCVVAERLVDGYLAPVERCPPMDALGYAKAAVEREDWQRAHQFAARATGAEAHQAAPAWRLLAKLARRAHDAPGEERALHGVLRTDLPVGVPEAHLALSKFYEHRAKKMTQALGHAQHTLLAEGRPKHARRIARLQRREVMMSLAPPG